MLEDSKNRKQPNDRRKRRQKRKKKINSAENAATGQNQQSSQDLIPELPNDLHEANSNKDTILSNAKVPELHPDNPEVQKITPLNTESLAQPPQAPNLDQTSMSPRKQTLLRHKKGSSQASEPSFVSEAKEYKKHRKQHPANSVSTSETNTEDDDQKYLMLLAQQNLEGKASLFRYRAARILVYHEQIKDPVLQSSPGTLLGHGDFEIFQLHNGDVTYLACGRSFVYPLLPKLKILRISLNQFILPLSNPERYWKINLDTEDVTVIEELEGILQKIVKYTDLSMGAGKSHSLPKYFSEDSPKQDPAHELVNATTQTPKKNIRQNGTAEQAQSAEVSSSHAGHVDKASQYKPFFSDIPESPPSAPISPQQIFEADNSFQLLPLREPRWPIQREKSDQSMTSAIASFSFTEQNARKQDSSKLRQPKPVVMPQANPSLHANPHAIPHIIPHGDPLANPHVNNVPHENPVTHRNLISYKHHSIHNGAQARHKGDAKSDTSSMDSLLDEYEENISTTKSINYNIPRSQSRTMSLASSAYPPAINYQRGKIPLVPDITSNRGSVTHETVEEEQENEEFFKTSLSQYNRARQSTHSQRSRRSSPSELYNSVSNWMEPNVRIQPTLSHSRSNYSLSSARNSVSAHRTQEAKLKDIYKSITENNLHASFSPNGRRQSVGSSREYGPRPKTNTLSAVSENRLMRGETQSQKSASSRNGNRNGREQLSSTDVYRLVSARSGRSESVNRETKRGSISRLFGW